eukprot:1528961-Pleurochrysis_carterae.AAC.1
MSSSSCIDFRIERMGFKKRLNTFDALVSLMRRRFGMRSICSRWNSRSHSSKVRANALSA